jgi:HK97 family phage prohead protease
MKSKIKLSDFTPHLPAQLQEGLDVALKDTETVPELHRAVAFTELAPVADEKTFIGYASTRNVDRDNEVILPGGLDLSQFRKAPVVLWGHAWSMPPVGRDTAVESDGYGLKTRSLMADTALANDLWQLVKGGFLKTSSIGFIPLAYTLPEHKDYGQLMDTARKWPEWDRKAEPSAFVTKAILLEHSLVAVPSCVDALITSVKEFKLEALAKLLSTEPKPWPTVLPPAVSTAVDTHAVPKTFEPRLIKTAEQLQIELQAEVYRSVVAEIQRRMGRV